MHRRHHIDGQIDGRITGCRICDIRAVDERAALGAAGALQIDVSVRSANHARNEREQGLEPLIHIWRVANCLLVMVSVVAGVLASVRLAVTVTAVLTVVGLIGVGPELSDWLRQ